MKFQLFFTRKFTFQSAASASSFHAGPCLSAVWGEMTCDDIWHHLKVRKLQKSRNGYLHINIVSRFFHTVIINNYICFLYFSVCRLMVTEIQRKLKIFGTVKTFTKEGRPVYYKELVVYLYINNMQDTQYIINNTVNMNESYIGDEIEI